MTIAKVVGLIAAAYAVVCLVVYLARNRLVFPIRGGETGEPRRYRLEGGETIEVRTADGERLRGWLLSPARETPKPWPVLLWFHGNGETVAGLAEVLRAFRPAHAALVAVDYRGYGGSTGNPTVANATADAAAVLAWLGTRQELDAGRVVVYGRSVGSGPAVALAAAHRVAGLVLESAFTSLPAMARLHFPAFPAFLAAAGFDNLAAIPRVTCPVLFVHGDADRTIPIAMGRALAARTAKVEAFVQLRGADHNDTYDLGGESYPAGVRQFVERVTAVSR